jgi:hypothetical protein
VQDILDYCAREYPRARVWLNPVIVGEGALRTSRSERINPDYLFHARSETRLQARFYNIGAAQNYESPHYDWGCLAGDLFFDIKPNGDFWLCQDQASPVRLNVLDPDFHLLRKHLDKGARRTCSGCVYSCYYLVQKGLEPRHWPDLALLWWQAHTQPGSPERGAAERFGFTGAVAALLLRSLRNGARTAAAACLALLLLTATLAAQPAGGELPPDDVLARMESVQLRQHDALRQWSHQRVYRAANPGLRREATARFQVAFTAPQSKTWRLLEAEGSNLILNRVLIPLLQAEQEAAQLAIRDATDINRANYDLRFAGFDQDLNAYLFDAEPRLPGRYHFRGRIAIDAQTFAVCRTQGQPALRPSFWVRRTSFVHEYRPYGPYWLPARHRTSVELRILGHSTLEIDYGDYQFSSAPLAGQRPTLQPASRQTP